MGAPWGKQSEERAKPPDTHRRNNGVDPKVSAGGGEEVLQVPERRFPCSLWRAQWS